MAANTDSKVQQSINKLISLYQEIADQEKTASSQREAAQKRLDTALDDVAEMKSFDKEKMTPEKIGAFLFFTQSTQLRLAMGDFAAQLAMARFDLGLIDGVNEHLNSVKSDIPTYRKILGAMNEYARDLKPSKIKADEPTFGIATSPPDGDYGTWKFTLVPVVMDKNFKVKQVEKLDFNLSVSMEVLRHTENALSGKFNIPASYTKAGDKYEPLTLSVETKAGEPVKMLVVRGLISGGGQPLRQIHVPMLQVKKAGSAGFENDQFDDGFRSKGPKV